MRAPGRFGTIQSAPPPTPRQQAARALADAVLQALDGGDLVGAQAAAAALYEFTSRLSGEGNDAGGSTVVDPEHRRA